MFFYDKLSSQVDKIEFDCLDLLRDSLLASLTCMEVMGLLHYFKRAVEILNKIEQKNTRFSKTTDCLDGGVEILYSDGL